MKFCVVELVAGACCALLKKQSLALRISLLEMLPVLATFVCGQVARLLVFLEENLGKT
jgi:hypothetical protein